MCHPPIFAVMGHPFIFAVMSPITVSPPALALCPFSQAICQIFPMLPPSAPLAIAVICPPSLSPVNWPPHAKCCCHPPPAVIPSSPSPANQPPVPVTGHPSHKCVRYS